MDPEANLTAQLDLARAVIEANDAGERQSAECADDALKLAELVLALDEWRRKGGFDPYQTEETR